MIVFIIVIIVVSTPPHSLLHGGGGDGGGDNDIFGSDSCGGYGDKNDHDRSDDGHDKNGDGLTTILKKNNLIIKIF